MAADELIDIVVDATMIDGEILKARAEERHPASRGTETPGTGTVPRLSLFCP